MLDTESWLGLLGWIQPCAWIGGSLLHFLSVWMEESELSQAAQRSEQSMDQLTLWAGLNVFSSLWKTERSPNPDKHLILNLLFSMYSHVIWSSGGLAWTQGTGRDWHVETGIKGAARGVQGWLGLPAWLLMVLLLSQWDQPVVMEMHCVSLKRS